jgi:hypothetical protein
MKLSQFWEQPPNRLRRGDHPQVCCASIDLFEDLAVIALAVDWRYVHPCFLQTICASTVVLPVRADEPGGYAPDPSFPRFFFCRRRTPGPPPYCPLWKSMAYAHVRVERWPECRPDLALLRRDMRRQSPLLASPYFHPRYALRQMTSGSGVPDGITDVGRLSGDWAADSKGEQSYKTRRLTPARSPRLVSP